jgi:hypothetical protein
VHPQTLAVLRTRAAPLGWKLITGDPLADLARAFPETPIVLNHVGGPIGIGPYAGHRDEVFAVWRAGIEELARCPNMHVKLGGLGMRLFGFDLHTHDMPPSSEQLAAAWRPYVETCIAAFGASRAMFESNFPVDKGGGSYHVFWNAFKRLAAGCSAADGQPRSGRLGVSDDVVDVLPGAPVEVAAARDDHQARRGRGFEDVSRQFGFRVVPHGRDREPPDHAVGRGERDRVAGRA